MRLPHSEVIPILDFGSQTAQLIARRVREAGCYSVLVSPSITIEQLRAMSPKGIILSGGPSSVYESGAPKCDPKIFDLGVPVLGICYGMQLACQIMGATVSRGDHREFGRAQIQIAEPGGLFAGVPDRSTVWMSHGDQVTNLNAAQFSTLATTATCPYAAVKSVHSGRVFYGVQFHPEVTTHTARQGTDSQLPL